MTIRLFVQDLNKTTTKLVLTQLRKLDWAKYGDYVLKVLNITEAHVCVWDSMRN
jgi:hypothetical protein